MSDTPDDEFDDPRKRSKDWPMGSDLTRNEKIRGDRLDREDAAFEALGLRERLGNAVCPFCQYGALHGVLRPKLEDPLPGEIAYRVIHHEPLSSAAVACPRCGHPLSHREDDDSLGSLERDAVNG